MTYAAANLHAVPPMPVVSSLAPRPDQAPLWIAHKAPVPFADAVKRVLGAASSDGARTDAMADLRAWGFGSVDHKTMQIAQMVGGSSAPLALRKTAFAQLASRAGVPVAYLATLPEKLQVACMNWGLAQTKETEPALLRCAGGEVRAIVSDRYAAFDDATLLEIVDDALKASDFRNHAMVRSTVIGAHMVLRLTIPSGGVEVKKGDVIEWGIDIANSELGLRSVQVTPVTYRLICTNGMRSANEGTRLRLAHRGDALVLRDRVKAVIPTALAEARGELEVWKRSVSVLIDNALDEIDSLRGFGLSSGETRAIGRRLVQLPETTSQEDLTTALKGMRTTAFDMANAVTETARDRSDVAGRLSLEETGHRYLTRKAGA
jgi:hypothetical protein